ncbi:pyridoxamine 5'-phosphate oxidase family protein [Jeongeupia sp. USM3]|uniref:pyridoxamine 5'-phosphate oxidase family protein n=1 Tax=Jeongeupia sp. USM3 TaxID=1906741 RepID=UPI00089E0658|nr:pyridoxamine 5'-phosphate oxidase family protein [Jeongeupia sp. USM3]AOY00491.1 hypothetical protein BJP62_08590 [Jeongeupia sp. USM3]
MAEDLRPFSQRAALLLQGARLVTLATTDADGRPWDLTANYVFLAGRPVQLLWYSMRDALHARNIADNPRVTGSIFRVDLAPPVLEPGLDGLRFSGKARAVAGGDVELAHERYFRLGFPDEQLRKQWMLPLADFTEAGSRCFYTLTIEAWWLLDIGRQQDRQDRHGNLPEPAQIAP